MINNIILLLTILAYSMIVSQSFMYMLAFKNVQLNLEVTIYTTLRKLIDANMRVKFKYVIYIALFTNLMLVISTINHPGTLKFISAAIAFIALIADTMLTIKASLPVNDIINTWSSDNFPSDWKDYRSKWFSIFHYRQMINIGGFVILLFGALFGTK